MIVTESNVIMTWEAEGIRHRGCPKKTWSDCVKNDMESLCLSQKDTQFRNKWRRTINEQPAKPGSPGKIAVKMECLRVHSVAHIVRQRYNSGFVFLHVNYRRNEVNVTIK